KTVSMPVKRNDHQSQLSATPCSRTMFVTRLGVSVENVVATMETPTSHHGAALPDVKNSAVLFPARRKKKIAGRNEITTEAATIPQSRLVSCIAGRLVRRRPALSDRLEAGVVPGCHSPADVGDTGEALLLQDRRRERGAVAPGADRRDRFGAVELAGARREIVQGNVPGLGDVAGLPLAGTPHARELARRALRDAVA